MLTGTSCFLFFFAIIVKFITNVFAAKLELHVFLTGIYRLTAYEISRLMYHYHFSSKTDMVESLNEFYKRVS